MRLLTFVLALLALVFVPSSPARAQSSSEHIARYGFDAVIDDHGNLAVTETIAYDFGSTAHHGIFRDIPTRLAYDAKHERVYRLTDIAVSSSDAPHGVKREAGPGGTTRLRIGDPNTTVTGQHTYELSYRLEGALNAFPDHVELYWNAIGDQWEIPIDNVTATVTAPVAMNQVTCFAGSHGSTLPCAQSSVDGRRARFTQDHLEPFQALTFVAGLPPGSVSATGPILEEIWSPARAFATTRATVGGALAVLLAVLGGLSVLLWRVGRDRRVVGSAVDVAFATPGSSEERVPLFGRGETPVQVEPPDKLRPGQIGTLVDERANPLDITATIVDLAVRGYLRIEEITKAHWFAKVDWKLTKIKPGDDLLPYEKLLLDSLFETGDASPGTGGTSELELSDLKNKFATRLQKVERALYDDAIERGWFAGRPDRVRQLWMAAGVGVAAIGVALTVGAAAKTHLAIVPMPIVLGGLLLMLLSGRMPRRTTAGTGVLVRALGFKRFIDDSEKDRARFAEQQHLFTEYLPYAIVFGATDQWAKAFAGLDGALPDQSSWYVSSRPFTYVMFSHSMDGFTTTSAGTIASTPSGSGTSGFGGGGFSGGGGGGGGGGSW